MTPEQVLEGMVIPVDKPYGWTSFQVVNFLKWRLIRLTGNKKLKIGHAGTLDPLATGLLLVCTGKMTKSISHLQDGEKEYHGSSLLGYVSESYDLEKRVNPVLGRTAEVASLEEIVSGFTGEIEQYPPMHSAVMINGKRAYDMARSGTLTGMKPRVVEIKRFGISNFSFPYYNFEVVCSKGTYIRSLIYDLGVKVCGGGVLTALRRVRSGEYTVSNAYKISDLKIMLDKGVADSLLSRSQIKTSS